MEGEGGREIGSERGSERERKDERCRRSKEQREMVERRERGGREMKRGTERDDRGEREGGGGEARNRERWLGGERERGETEMKRGTERWFGAERERGETDEVRNSERLLGERERWIKQEREEQSGWLEDRQREMKRGTKKERVRKGEREYVRTESKLEWRQHSGYKSMCVLREDRGLDKIRMSPWIEDLSQ